MKRPTQKEIDAICQQISNGLYPHVAAAAVGVTPSLLDDWMRIGSQPNPPKPYADAHTAISAAVAAMETKAVRAIQVGMADDWKAAAWWLERTRPTRWGTKKTSKRTPNEPQDAAPEEIKNKGTQKQHADLFKKILLRRNLIAKVGEGACYVPFIGDGDIAVELYANRKIYGADLSPTRIEIAKTRLPAANLRVADCDKWPFDDITVEPLAIIDLDAYHYPYHAFYATVKNAPLADRCAFFFTDGQRITAVRNGIYHTPYGEKIIDMPLTERRKVNNLYRATVTKPWITEWAAQNGWKIVKEMSYLRDRMMYWGIVLERAKTPISLTIEKV